MSDAKKASRPTRSYSVAELERGEVAVLTIPEVALVLRVSQPTLRAGIEAGSVPSIRISNRIVVPVVALLRLLAGEEEPMPAGSTRLEAVKGS